MKNYYYDCECESTDFPGEKKEKTFWVERRHFLAENDDAAIQMWSDGEFLEVVETFSSEDYAEDYGDFEEELYCEGNLIASR